MRMVVIFEEIIDKIETLYYHICYLYEKAHYKRNYSNLLPKIYYDKTYDTYVHPKMIDDPGCIEYVCSEIIGHNVFYHYEIEENKEHAHTIAAVFLDAYNYAETFVIPKKYESEYSNQELDEIFKLVNRGKVDRKE